MRHRLLAAVRTAVAIAALAGLAATPALADSWTGWVTDSSCGAKGANADHKGCAEKCHRGGTPLVFYNDADQELYELDDQDLAAQHLGHAVTVTGKLDGKKIAVEKIEAAPAKS